MHHLRGIMIQRDKIEHGVMTSTALPLAVPNDAQKAIATPIAAATKGRPGATQVAAASTAKMGALIAPVTRPPAAVMSESDKIAIIITPAADPFP